MKNLSVIKGFFEFALSNEWIVRNPARLVRNRRVRAGDDDVSTFHISRLLDTGECHIRTTKNGNKVYTWVPIWLQERIRARVDRFGPFIFGEHTTKNLDVITDVWRRELVRLWELCGPWTEKPTPHRFRHTFARILLQRPNVTVR